MYRYALSQAHTPIYGSEYIEKVIDWEELAIARDVMSIINPQTPARWQITGDGAVRSFRLGVDEELDFSASRNIAGTMVAGQERYVHATSSQSELQLRSNTSEIEASVLAFVSEANGRISDLARGAKSLAFLLQSHGEVILKLQHPQQCRLEADGRVTKPSNMSLEMSTNSRGRTIGQVGPSGRGITLIFGPLWRIWGPCVAVPCLSVATSWASLA